MNVICNFYTVNTTLNIFGLIPLLFDLTDEEQEVSHEKSYKKPPKNLSIIHVTAPQITTMAIKLHNFTYWYIVYHKSHQWQKVT